MRNFCWIGHHLFLSGHQGILNLYLVNLPPGYQRQSVPEEVGSRCADDSKNPHGIQQLKCRHGTSSSSSKICVYGT
jgi:hypothetical protein